MLEQTNEIICNEARLILLWSVYKVLSSGLKGARWKIITDQIDILKRVPQTEIPSNIYYES